MTTTTDEEPSPVPLRVQGGFGGALRTTLRGWWEERYVLIFLNILWTMALVTVVALPPFTAALFAVAREAIQGQYVEWHSFSRPFRRYFKVAWAWGAAFFPIVAIALANLWLYRGAMGALWTALRWVWFIVLLAWTMVNLFFWPFWFAQEPMHRTLRTTWRNSLTFVVANPIPVILAVLTGLFVYTMVPRALFIVLFFLTLITWTALFATAVVAAYLPQQTRS